MSSLFFVSDVGDSDETVSVWRWLRIHRAVAARLLRVTEHRVRGYMDNLWTTDEIHVFETPFALASRLRRKENKRKSLCFIYNCILLG